MVDCVILSALMSSPFGKSILMVGEAVIASLKVVVTRTTSASFTLSSKSSVTMDITVGTVLSKVTKELSVTPVTCVPEFPAVS